MKKIRLSALLLALVMITSCMVGGTFAKYTSSADGSDTATVAKWSFDVGGTEITTTDTITFDLFNTIKDTNKTDNESDVFNGKIAPGTSGSFKLELKNTSEVNALYTIKLEEVEGTQVPLYYSLTGSDNAAEWYNTIDTLNAALANKQIGMDTAPNNTASHTVYWEWVYQETGDAQDIADNDAADTALGILAQTVGTAPTVMIKATVTATQVD